MSFATSVSSSYTYCGNYEVNFFVSDDGALDVTVDTERLHIRSINEADDSNYAALFGDSEVMGNFATGQTKTKDEITDRIKIFG